MNRKTKLPLGKVPIGILKKILDYVDTDDSVLVPPGIGIDAAIVRSHDNIIVSACDPITGASREVGWLSVHVNANDIAACAARPQWYIVTLLFPEDSGEEEIYETMRGIRQGLREVGAVLVAGHTELTNKVKDTIVVGTMIGTPMVRGRYVSNKGAKVGDIIIMTKGAGIEGTWILAETFHDKLGLSEKELENIRKLKKMISVLPDVKALIGIGVENIHAMHDATEGGLLGALYEVAEASGVGFEVYEEDIVILEETQRIAERLMVDPLKLISSGTLIAVIDSRYSDMAIKALRNRGIQATVIGHITSGRRIIRRLDGGIVEIKEPPIDELWRILGEG